MRQREQLSAVLSLTLAVASMIAWMRWRFMNDPAGRSLFVGADCQVCTDPAFSGIVKTPALDAL
jgi:hypothetical protein